MRLPFYPARPINAWDKALVVLILFALTIGFITFKDYGLSWDYEPHDTYGRQVMNFYKTMGQDRDAIGTPVAHHIIPMRTFGGGFEVFVNLLREILPGDYYQQRHLATFLFSLIGVVGAAFCGRCIAGPQAGFFAGLFLLLYPVYYGHSFINHKDLPVAVTYIWVLAMIVYSIDMRRLHPWRCTLFLGFALGYLMSVRAGMFFAFGFVPLAWFLSELKTFRWRSADITGLSRIRPSVFLMFIGVVAVAWAVMCALWPYAMMHPIEAPMAAIGKFSSFPWSLPMFFEGNYYLPSNAPWHYIPTWLLIQVPEYLLMALIIALYMAYVTWRRGNDWIFGPKCIKIMLLLFAIVIPITGIVWKNATIYDSVRHLLFLSPVLAVLSAVGFVTWLAEVPPSHSSLRLCLVNMFGSLLLLAVANLTSLHPYQYIFANYVFAGGVERASQRFESDYWATCTNEAVSWIFANYPSANGKNTVISGWSDQLQIKYPVEKFQSHRLDFTYSPNEVDADLYITTGRFRGHVRQDRLVHVVTRDGAKLCYIFARSK